MLTITTISCKYKWMKILPYIWFYSLKFNFQIEGSIEERHTDKQAWTPSTIIIPYQLTSGTAHSPTTLSQPPHHQFNTKLELEELPTEKFPSLHICCLTAKIIWTLAPDAPYPLSSYSWSRPYNPSHDILVHG